MTAFGRKKDSDRSPSESSQTDGGGTEVEYEATEGQEPAETEEVDELAAAQAALADAEERALRAQADYQNLRRRQAEDIDAAVKRAKSEVLGEAVTVLDYLDMALAAPVESTDAKNLKIGIEMTRGQLQALFDRLQVRPITIEGAFDPTYHQAVSTVETDEYEPGAIVEVVRGGWMMGSSVLRFAQVRVAAAPEPAEAEAAEVPPEGAPEDTTDGSPAGESDARDGEAS